MEVILLERISRLGQMGDVVRVKDGFARNFLLPRGKALRATDENRTRFEGMKSDLQARSAVAKAEATRLPRRSTARASPCCGRPLKSGQLFGSVSPRDIVSLVGASGFQLTRNQIELNSPIKTIGQHKVPLSLHPEIETSITIIVARNADEAAAHRPRRGRGATARADRAGSRARDRRSRSSSPAPAKRPSRKRARKRQKPRRGRTK